MISNDIVISVEHISKLYHLGVISRKTLSDEITFGIRRLIGKNTDIFSKVDVEERGNFWALNDVSFEVKRGDAVALVGKNGAGKSTMLKILARITGPTAGHAILHGRVGTMLEVGTGFHPEFTGRENIYMNGTMLGMKKSEIDAKFDDIVAFSGVEKFLNTPVKRYSSGMYVRLAFAIASHLEPEILLIDEILAVGDAEFREKCLEKMKSVAQNGTTIVFVSHSRNQILSFCNKAIWFENGTLKAYDAADKIMNQYQPLDNSNHTTTKESSHL